MREAGSYREAPRSRGVEMIILGVADPDPNPHGSTTFGRIRIQLDPRSGSTFSKGGSEDPEPLFRKGGSEAGSAIPKCGSQDPAPRKN